MLSAKSLLFGRLFKEFLMKQSFRAVAWTSLLALLLITLIACGPAGGTPAAEEPAADADHSDVTVGEAVGEAPDDAIHSAWAEPA